MKTFDAQQVARDAALLEAGLQHRSATLSQLITMMTIVLRHIYLLQISPDTVDGVGASPLQKLMKMRKQLSAMLLSCQGLTHF